MNGLKRGEFEGKQPLDIRVFPLKIHFLSNQYKKLGNYCSLQKTLDNNYSILLYYQYGNLDHRY